MEKKLVRKLSCVLLSATFIAGGSAIIVGKHQRDARNNVKDDSQKTLVQIMEQESNSSQVSAKADQIVKHLTDDDEDKIYSYLIDYRQDRIDEVTVVQNTTMVLLDRLYTTWQIDTPDYALAKAKVQAISREDITYDMKNDLKSYAKLDKLSGILLLLNSCLILCNLGIICTVMKKPELSA